MWDNIISNPVKDVTFVAFDIETTGLKPVLNRIVEIGGIKFKGDQVLETFGDLIDPRMPIPIETTRIHGITDEMVKGKSVIDQVLPDFVAFIDDAIPVAHNTSFDVSFIAYDLSRLHLKTSPLPILDTCSLSRSLFPGVPSHSLENLARWFHIDSETSHRAVSDAEICMKIFKECILKLGGPEKVQLEKMIHHNGSVFYFNYEAVLFEEPYHLIGEAFQSNSSVDIVYKKASGETTTRRITPLTVGTIRNSVIIEAFCHLRQEKRTFRLDRIVQIGNDLV
jgi:DNA polymerase III epsilon subunit family exonuclease